MNSSAYRADIFASPYVSAQEALDSLFCNLKWVWSV